MNIQQAIARLATGEHLSRSEMHAVMAQIMSGGADDAQIGGLLVALRMAGETAAEITGAAAAMRELATPVPLASANAVDIVGTGGDGVNLFNISTAAVFVAAAAGARVAKHGNRAVSSSSGAADLLECAGVHLSLTPAQVAHCIEQVGIGWMFAPDYHSAMRYASGPRRSLGMRTMFNLLGPLTNPAGVRRHVIGVYRPEYCHLFAQVLKTLGSEHALIVHSDDGLDEISLAADTLVVELKHGELRELRLRPEDFAIGRQSLEGLSVSSAGESLALINDALGPRKTAAGAKAADIIALNAGMAIYVGAAADTPERGVAMAEDAMASGLAAEKMRELAVFTSAFKE